MILINVGIFTDTYFPQISGVATSVKTLCEQLKLAGHQVYIFTTTDPHVKSGTCERNIFRFSSIPFISFKDRRIAIRGLFQAYQIAKYLNLDIVHTQTEFSMGIIGRFVAKKLKIPCIHTYHTMYEDYLHYVANGKLLKPAQVRVGTLAFCHHLTGVIAPSKRVLDKLISYGVKSPIRIIPTGIDIDKYTKSPSRNLRAAFGFSARTPVLLSVSRLAEEKNVRGLVSAMPKIISRVPDVKLVIVGSGPSKASLVKQVNAMHLKNYVIFTGEVSNEHVNWYYHMANVFVSASDSESQGLTYIEALASGLKVVVYKSAYTKDLLDRKTLGMTFTSQSQYVRDVVNYLNHPQRFLLNDPAFRKRKLAEISSRNFAKQVVDFYRSSQLEFEREFDG